MAPWRDGGTLPRATLVLAGLVTARTLAYVASFARAHATSHIYLYAARPSNHTAWISGACAAPCGLDCNAARADARARGLDYHSERRVVTCIDRPNEGKEFGGCVGATNARHLCRSLDRHHSLTLRPTLARPPPRHAHHRCRGRRGRFVAHAISHYERERGPAVVFAPTELTAHRRMTVVRELLTPPATVSANGSFAAAEAQPWPSDCIRARGEHRRDAASFSLTAAVAAAGGCVAVEGGRGEVRCTRTDTVERPIAIEDARWKRIVAADEGMPPSTAAADRTTGARRGGLGGGARRRQLLSAAAAAPPGGGVAWRRRTQTLTRATPNELGAWLVAHAPPAAPASRNTSHRSSGVDSGGEEDDDWCLNGVFRTSGEAIRRRPRGAYEGIARELAYENPEAGHFLERAALVVFAAPAATTAAEGRAAPAEEPSSSHRARRRTATQRAAAAEGGSSDTPGRGLRFSL